MEQTETLLVNLTGENLPGTVYAVAGTRIVDPKGAHLNALKSKLKLDHPSSNRKKLMRVSEELAELVDETMSPCLLMKPTGAIADCSDNLWPHLLKAFKVRNLRLYRFNGRTYYDPESETA